MSGRNAIAAALWHCRSDGSSAKLLQEFRQIAHIVTWRSILRASVHDDVVADVYLDMLVGPDQLLPHGRCEVTKVQEFVARAVNGALVSIFEAAESLVLKIRTASLFSRCGRALLRGTGDRNRR